MRKAASHGDNTAKGKLGFDVLIILLTEAVGAYARATKAIKLGEEVRAPQGFKSPYPEKWQRSTFSTSQGSEFMDDAVRMTEQPLSNKGINSYDVNAAEHLKHYNELRNLEYDFSELASWLSGTSDGGYILEMTPKSGKWMNGIWHPNRVYISPSICQEELCL